MRAIALATTTPTVPPSGPTSERSKKLSEQAASWKRFATYCKARSAEIRLMRSSRASSTYTSSPGTTDGGER